MRQHTTSMPLPRGVLASASRGALAALLLCASLLSACDAGSSYVLGTGTSISMSTGGGGAGDVSVKVRRPGYALTLECDGPVSFTDDDSDVATLAPGCEFTLAETLDGVKHKYTVHAGADGTLTRGLTRAGEAVPLEGAGREWLAAALPRMFRESGFDAEARVTRLLARGGPAAVLAEVELMTSDYAKGSYLGALLGTAPLDDEQRAAALAAAAHIESDFESATLLVGAVANLPAGPGTQAAWLAAARGIDSDFELRRTLQAALPRAAQDAAFASQVVALAAEAIDSDFELRVVLTEAAPLAGDPAIAASRQAAADSLDSDFELRVVLTEAAPLAGDPAIAAACLDAADSLDSDFEQGVVLKALAARVAGDEALNRRYREVAADMSDFERGAALLALDDASRR